MKNFFLIILSAIVILCLYSCGNILEDEITEKNTTELNEKISENAVGQNSNEELVEYIRHGTLDQYILVHKDIDSGSFDKPHSIGDTLRLRHTFIEETPMELGIFDYNITFEQVLSGEEARSQLQQSCSNFVENEYLFEDNDLYYIKVNIKFNPESDVQDISPILNSGVYAIDSKGTILYMDYKFDINGYSSEVVNNEVNTWLTLFIPKYGAYKAVYAVGYPMEAPGLIPVVYFDVQTQ